MKILALCLFAAAVCASAQSGRFQTFTVAAAQPANINENTIATNCVSIRSDEVVRIATARPIIADGYSPPFASAQLGNVYLLKDGLRFNAYLGDVIQGPAIFETVVQNGGRALLTLEYLPVQSPPGQTLVIAPGTNLVAVALECSTNLVHWSTATNGLYGSPDAAKFFRIRAER